MYSDPYEKLSHVRRTMMVPVMGRKYDILADSFHECDQCLGHLDESDLDAHAAEWLALIKRTTEVSSVAKESQSSLYLQKAKMMNTMEIRDYADAIDRLCDYFFRRHHAKTRSAQDAALS